MKTRAKVCLLSVALGMTLTAAGCEGEKLEGECLNNADCPKGFHCSTDKRCLCTSDTACAEDEFCNAQGSCQKRLGCLKDSDCGTPGLFRCDTSSGRGVCLCRNDDACADGEFCNTSGHCQRKAGCILDSDCGEASAWRCKFNPETEIGECFCKTNAACGEDEFCNLHGYCQLIDKCLEDEDCPVAGTYCDLESGECLCDYEYQTGCEDDEICNSAGYCQPRPGCYDNGDCEHLENHYCDFTTRTCVPEDECYSDRQCPIGTVCRQNECIEGCDDDNDCPLDKRCVDSTCQTGCQDDSFCNIMQYCQDGVCVDSYSEATPYCLPCSTTSFPPEQCGTNPYNRCLLYPFDEDAYTQSTGSHEYCGVDCSDGQPCPHGFECHPVMVVDLDQECTTDADCPENVTCLTNLEDDTWYCGCNEVTNPCPDDFCLMGECFYTKDPCDEDEDCSISCEEIDEGGGVLGCVIARNCGLVEGMHCPAP